VKVEANRGEFENRAVPIKGASDPSKFLHFLLDKNMKVF